MFKYHIFKNDFYKVPFNFFFEFKLILRYIGVLGGFWFMGIHMLQMYYKTHVDDIPEEGFTGERHTNLRTFATLMIEGGEILLIICVTFLGLIFCWRAKIFIYLFNQLIDYNKKLSGKFEYILYS